MYVTSKEYMPSMASNANSCGFIVQEHIMLSVVLYYSVIRHQSAMQNNAGVSALAAEKCFFQVCTHRSAMFVWGMPTGVY